MRKLIEQKLENARNDLENTRKEKDVFLFGKEMFLTGIIGILEDLLNSNELKAMESKVEKYDEFIEDKKSLSEIIYQDLRKENQELREQLADFQTGNYVRLQKFVACNEERKKYEQETKILKDGIKEIFNSDNLEIYDQADKKVYVNAYDLHSDYEDNDYGGNEYPYLVDEDGKIKAILEVLENDR